MTESLPRFAGQAPLDRFHPGRCVILVPYYGSIVPECDDALRELERRGYTVRRIGGYAAIDQARNRMATDALSDGFEETLWIDSDMVFDPAVVDRLRTHAHAVVGAVGVRKGIPDIACHLLPEMTTITFGRAGGLVEVLYLGTGFLLVRRAAYMAVQEVCQLPLCNEQFGTPVIPFFQPLIRPLEGGGHWYLGEDFAFCHRCREAGFKIYVDTTIRLGHVGQHKFTWEDIVPPRPMATSYVFPVAKSRVAGAPEVTVPAIAALAARFPWPERKPEAPAPSDRNGLPLSVARLLKHSVPHTARSLVVIGAVIGRSTRFLAEVAPQATVAAIEHRHGELEQSADSPPPVDRLHETFLAECWELRERIIPLRMESHAALRLLADEQLEPDAIFIDADHSYESVTSDVKAALDLFPKALILGGDWQLESVRNGVEQVVRERGLQCDVLESAWRIVRV